jgi:cytochrome d ubiquinol oxidase subunit I
MAALATARWQFAMTSIFHFFFVPLTLGLSILVALFETRYVRTGDETYKKMARFWGKIFLINFALGVVTGIVQEFHFGLNWSEYARFMGDIFGAPLAIEALLAFYLESTFLGVWIFGWDRLPRGVHLAAAWLVAIGSSVSALWILIANSFMQHPVGYAIEGGRAVMTDFFALITNPDMFYHFSHVLTAGLAMAGFIVMGFSAWHLLRKHAVEFFQRSFRYAAVCALIGAVLVVGVGHLQGQYLVREQPIKMAAAEALWNTEAPASFNVVAWIDQGAQRNPLAITIPAVTSLLSYNNLTQRVEGLIDLQAAAEAQYGPGNYLPPVTLEFWVFRLMVGIGLLMILLAFLAVLWSGKKGRLVGRAGFLKVLIPAAVLPYLANTAGWLLAETGRWPWIVYGLQKIQDAVSPNVSAGSVLFSLLVFGVLYAVLAVIGVRLALRYGSGEVESTTPKSPAL